MNTEKDVRSDVTFLDMQAQVGVTKHMGGFESTNELLALCHIEQAHEVLNVGCGIGVGSAYIARKYGCHVMGVDISEKMIEWSRQRAVEQRVADKVEFRVADVLGLPFEADRFDIVIVESVLIFVEDKAQAIRECVRVTRPGGRVGLSEGFATKQPPPELAAQIRDAIGPAISTLDVWRALWDESGLQDRLIKTCSLEPRKEIRDRMQWIGWRWLLRAWGRSLRLYITNPGIRQSIKKMFDVPPEAYHYIGYALFVGRK